MPSSSARESALVYRPSGSRIATMPNKEPSISSASRWLMSPLRARLWSALVISARNIGGATTGSAASSHSSQNSRAFFVSFSGRTHLRATLASTTTVTVRSTCGVACYVPMASSSCRLRFSRSSRMISALSPRFFSALTRPLKASTLALNPNPPKDVLGDSP